jgi:hypothetical protein
VLALNEIELLLAVVCVRVAKLPFGTFSWELIASALVVVYFADVLD